MCKDAREANEWDTEKRRRRWKKPVGEAEASNTSMLLPSWLLRSAVGSRGDIVECDHDKVQQNIMRSAKMILAAEQTYPLFTGRS